MQTPTNNTPTIQTATGPITVSETTAAILTGSADKAKAQKAKAAKPAPAKPVKAAPKSDKPKRDTKPANKPASSDKAAARAALATAINADRQTAFTLFNKLSTSESIPVKPFAAFAKSYKADCPFVAGAAKPTPRRCAAIVVACLASKQAITNGAKFPRRFNMRGSEYCIDNSGIKHNQAAGIIRYSAKTETITIIKADLIAGQCKLAGFSI